MHCVIQASKFRPHCVQQLHGGAHPVWPNSACIDVRTLAVIYCFPSTCYVVRGSVTVQEGLANKNRLSGMGAPVPIHIQHSSGGARVNARGPPPGQQGGTGLPRSSVPGCRQPPHLKARRPIKVRGRPRPLSPRVEAVGLPVVEEAGRKGGGRARRQGM